MQAVDDEPLFMSGTRVEGSLWHTLPEPEATDAETAIDARKFMQLIAQKATHCTSSPLSPYAYRRQRYRMVNCNGEVILCEVSERDGELHLCIQVSQRELFDTLSLISSLALRVCARQDMPLFWRLNMLRTTQDAWNLAQHLPPEGVTAGELHIGLQTWTRAQSGVVITLSFDDGTSVSHVWLEDTGWRALCEQMLGTSEVATVNALLLEEIAAWALSPLLAHCQASIVRENAAPCPCSALSEQWGVVFTWQVEQVVFQAVLFGNNDAGFKHLHALIVPDCVPTGPLPPLRCALYAGECELPLSVLRG